MVSFSRDEEIEELIKEVKKVREKEEKLFGRKFPKSESEKIYFSDLLSELPREPLSWYEYSPRKPLFYLPFPLSPSRYEKDWELTRTNLEKAKLESKLLAEIAKRMKKQGYDEEIIERFLKGRTFAYMEYLDLVFPDSYSKKLEKLEKYLQEELERRSKDSRRDFLLF